MYAFSLGMQKSVKTYSLYIVRQFWVYMPSPIVLRYFSIYVSNCADLRSPASIVSYFDCDLENLISVSFLTTCSTCLPLLQRCVKCSLKVRKLNREPTNVHTLTSLALTLPSSNKHFDYLILSTYKLHEIYLQYKYYIPIGSLKFYLSTVTESLYCLWITILLETLGHNTRAISPSLFLFNYCKIPILLWHLWHLEKAKVFWTLFVITK